MTMRTGSTVASGWIARWTRANHFILTTTTMQVGSTVVTSALGFFYWWTATHLYLPQAVGVAAASVSLMQLFATFSVLGLGTLLISELPRRSNEQGTLLKMALSTAAISGCVIGIVGAVVAFGVLRDWKASDVNLVVIALFIGGVSLTTVSLLLDQVVIGLNISPLMLSRNVIFAAVKLLAIAATAVLLLPRIAETIFATWIIGIIVSLTIILCLPIWGRFRARRSKLRAWELLRGLARSSMQHHILNLALGAPSMAMPTVALVVLSAASAAYFYSALTLASFAYMIPFALSISLFAAGSAYTSAVATRARSTLGLSFGVAVATNIVLLLGAHLILALFGKAYSENATVTLQILGLAVFPLILKDHFIALQRIRQRVGNTVIIASLGCLLELTLAVVGAIGWGLVGLSFGWLVALSVEAVYMGIPLVRLLVASDSPTTQV